MAEEILSYESLQKTLTRKQQVFCEQYLVNGYNGTKAALAAGYSKKTAYSIAGDNLKKAEIKAYIEALQARTAELVGVSPVMVANELKKMAFTNITDIFVVQGKSIFVKGGVDITSLPREVTDNIMSLKNTQFGIEVKMYNKDNALKQLSDLLGFNKQQVDVTTKGESINKKAIFRLSDGTEVEI